MRYTDFKIIIEGYGEVTQKFSQEADPQQVKKIIDAYRDLVNRNQVQGNERNIDWWGKQGWANFDRFVRAKSQQPSQTQQKQRRSVGDSHTLSETDDWLIVVPLDKDASCFHGKDTDWCTTKPVHDYFERYFRDTGVTLIYFLQKKTGDKWAMAVYDDGAVEYFDKADRSLNQQSFDAQTGLNSDQYYQEVSASGSPVQKKVEISRSEMRDDKANLEDRIYNIKQPAKRNVEIETLLFKVKDAKLLQHYIYELVDASPTKLIELDQNMQQLVVTQAPHLMRFISNLSDRSARMALKANVDHLQYINNPSDAIIRIAIEQDRDAIRHIANPPQDMIKDIIQMYPHSVFNIQSGLTTQNIIQATDAWLKLSEEDGGPDTRNGVPAVIDVTNWLRVFNNNGIHITDYEFYRWLTDNYKYGDNAIAVYFITSGKIYNDKIIKEILQRKPSFADALADIPK